MVGYGDSDVGVSIISYTMERNTFIDYSPAVGTDSMVWVTKPPQKVSAASNLLRIFDHASWLFILLSLVIVAVTIIIISSISHSLGVITQDNTLLLLLPLQMLLGEQLDTWFVKKDKIKKQNIIRNEESSG